MAKEFTEEQIKNKVRKLMRQAESPYPEEAQSAMLMAQKLLLKYKIDKGDLIEDEVPTEDIVQVKCSEMANTAWAMDLSGILAKNFGVIKFYYGQKNSKRPVFFGESDKAYIAQELYDYIVVWLNKRACSYATNMRNKFGIVKGVKQDFIVGFLKGLSDKFTEQTGADENKYALVLTVSPEVKAAYRQQVKTTSIGKPSMNTHGLGAARQAGYTEGKNFNTATNGMKTPKPGGELK